MQYTATTFSQPSNQRMLVGPQVMPVGHSDQYALSQCSDSSAFIDYLLGLEEVAA